MADDWDLTAVVRSCKSATHTASSAAAANTTSEAATKPVAFLEDSTFCNGLVKNTEVSSDDLFFDFPDLIEPRADAFEELQQFLPNPTTTMATSTNNNNPSTNSYGPLVIPNPPTISDFAGSSTSGQQQHHAQQIEVQIQQNPQQQQQQQINHFLPINKTAMSPHFHPGVPPPGYTELPGQQVVAPQPLVPRPGYMRPIMPIHPGVAHPRLPFPMHLTHQSPRSRRRKSQQKKMVREVTQENLASDLWAWRKYGQKPIKGSPHPRNYYRCSSSKGCAARKQVERSTKDPDIFIVTYSGDHTHPRPTHRNSLAGSTRNKFPVAAPAVNKDPISSPTAQSAAEGTADDEEDMNEDEDDAEDFLLLGPKMSDDMLEEEMKQMGCGTSSSESGGDDLSDRAAEGATVRGGC